MEGGAPPHTGPEWSLRRSRRANWPPARRQPMGSLPATAAINSTSMIDGRCRLGSTSAARIGLAMTRAKSGVPTQELQPV
jgi:hypothetical protein